MGTASAEEKSQKEKKIEKEKGSRVGIEVDAYGQSHKRRQKQSQVFWRGVWNNSLVIRRQHRTKTTTTLDRMR